MLQEPDRLLANGLLRDTRDANCCTGGRASYCAVCWTAREVYMLQRDKPGRRLRKPKSAIR